MINVIRQVQPLAHERGQRSCEEWGEKRNATAEATTEKKNKKYVGVCVGVCTLNSLSPGFPAQAFLDVLLLLDARWFTAATPSPGPPRWLDRVIGARLVPPAGGIASASTVSGCRHQEEVKKKKE